MRNSARSTTCACWRIRRAAGRRGMRSAQASSLTRSCRRLSRSAPGARRSGTFRRRDDGSLSLNSLRAALREPLLHFVLIGALLFAFTAWRQQQQDHNEIRITSGEIAQLAAFWETQSQRKPTADELRGLIEERIDEEVLAREAVRLGLDRDDVIVRRRLAQKMAFVSDDLAVMSEPAEADLRAYFDAHKEAYTTPDLYAL